jgi:hypothetical protein
MRAASDLEVGPPDRLGECSSLGEVPFSVGESPSPCLDDPEIQQCDCPQLAVHRDRIVRVVVDRSIEQVHLLEHCRELSVTSCQRQPQRRNRHGEAEASSRRSALDVSLGQRQLSSRFLQSSLVHVSCRVGQRQVRMIG